MVGRIQSWTTKFLTCAGRVQLIKSILFSIQVYWSQIFLLPKKLILLVESVYRKFLWTGNFESTRKTLIAWDRLSCPRVARGSNLLDIGTWNKAAMCKLLWNLCKKKDKLWVQWVHVYYKKYNPGWGTEPKQASWVIQKIFKAKKYFAEGGYTEDDVLRMKTFSIKDVYFKNIGEFSKVSWRRIIWNNAGLPKWIFIGYLAAHRRLQTRNRLKKGGCIIWDAMLRWLKIVRPVIDWEHEMQLAEQHCRGRSAAAEIYRMMLVGSMYYIWQERNARFFQEIQRTDETITRSLAQDIQCRGNVKKCLKRKLIELNSYPTV
uniref:Reverse transcriptase zinc-binding domain-containing protein n=1 Tax=Nicotiana tabacum TaxID=4097 RepID=A0A1S3ZBV4_TOBAC|nr:PREDICTED: uncharacterized protein LOC107785201 [Nicotiana tabacum]